jgi:ribosomal protein S4
MRRNPKYKIHFTTKNLLFRCSKKISKFKKSKWNFWKKQLKKILKKKVFINHSLIPLNLKRLEKKKSFFKNELLIRRDLKQIYDDSLKIKSIKKGLRYSKNVLQHNYIQLFLNAFLKLEYRLDILLYKFNFFPSVCKARQSIRQEDVLVNNYFISSNYIVKMGDVIKINNHIPDLTVVLNNTFQKTTFNSFAEVDYYAGAIIIVKNLNDLSIEDFSLLFPSYININTIYKSIKKV